MYDDRFGAADTASDTNNSFGNEERSTPRTSYYGTVNNPYPASGMGMNNINYSAGGINPVTPVAPQKKTKKKKGKVGFVIAMVAVMLVSLIAGGGATYFFLNANNIVSTKDTTDLDIADSSADDTQTIDGTSEDVNGNNSQTGQATQTGLTSSNDITIGTTTDNQTTLSTDNGSLSVAQIAEKCLPSVVAITNIGETEVRSMWGNFTQQSESAGSGIIVGQTDDELLILTNYHVVADNTTLSVVFSWEEGTDSNKDPEVINAVIKDYNTSRDIAVIAIKMDDLSADTISNIKIATVGSSDDLVLGEQVVAIGNALGYGQSVTTGIVSALNRGLESSGDTGNSSSNVYIQTDAAINPGNSGGALFNMKGELIGVNSAKMGGSTIEGMGYAIPISEIMDEVEIMMNQETRTTVDIDNRGYLGVKIVDVTSDISATYGLPQGAYVSAINEGSAAEAADLRKEDIIVGVNGKTITSSSELKDYLSYYEVGETVTITVARKSGAGYQNMDIEVTLGENNQISQDINGGTGNYSGDNGFGGAPSGDGFDTPSYDPFGG